MVEKKTFDKRRASSLTNAWCYWIESVNAFISTKMGGRVSSQRWEDLIEDDLERQRAIDREKKEARSEEKVEVPPAVSAPEEKVEVLSELTAVPAEKKGPKSPSKGPETKETAKKYSPEESPDSPTSQPSTPKANIDIVRKKSHQVFLSLDDETDMSCEFAEYKLTHNPQKLSIREVYELFQSAHNKNTGTNWAAKPSLYETCANLLHKRGEPVMADLVFHEGLKVVQEPAWLAKLKLGKARALAQTRSTAEAIKLLQSLPQEIQENEQDALNLFGRCYKVPLLLLSLLLSFLLQLQGNCLFIHVCVLFVVYLTMRCRII